MTDHMNFE